MARDVFDAIGTLPIGDIFSPKRKLVLNSPIGTAVLFAFLEKHGNPAKRAIIAPNQYQAQKIYESLLSFLPEEKVLFFPSDELLRAEAVSSSKELMAQRLYAMNASLRARSGVLVTHPSAVLRFLMSPETFLSSRLELRKGERYGLTSLRDSLVRMGYRKVNKIDQSLQFALRGDVLDIFSVNERKPLRFEFFDDELESIREFDIETQSSVAPREEAVVLPASEFLLPEGGDILLGEKVHALLEEEGKKIRPEDLRQLTMNVENSLAGILEKEDRPSNYRYMCLAADRPLGILHYFRPQEMLIIDEDSYSEAIEHIDMESREYYSELESSFRIPLGLRHYMAPREAFPSGMRVGETRRFAEKDSDIVLSFREAVSAGTGMSAIGPTIESYLSLGEKVVICGGDIEHQGLVTSFLEEKGISYEKVEGLSIPDGEVALSQAFLSRGFELPELKVAFLSPNELFGRRTVSSRFTARFKNATILRSAEELRPGDFVVHEYRGIGQFLSMETMEEDGIHRDFIKVAYAEGKILYVPLEQFRLLRKYAGREGVSPRLSRLGTNDWAKKKKQIEKKVGDLADRLYALYKERALEPGYAFPEDDELQKEFEDEFPYELTHDQSRALSEIKSDMEQPVIMDRLLCGDVGFGKTEVALRAAYKALLAGKQVAILCPTTLLARQHFDLAQDRFAGKGVRIAQLSRLVKPYVAKRTIEAMSLGEVDLVIGTHALLSKRVSFKDLGLLIIDEEQRFGVEQKERIKELKRRVDVLTLSATPIPRTLQMSLLGVRPLSEITTAPEGRMPIQTYVIPYEENVIGELLSRELARGGQVFYLHNKVASIHFRAASIQRLLPEARIGVIHGQMEKEEVEDVMGLFYDGEIDILVATSIIENGIDVPRANLIVVEDADHFGLSQLYQIKGRVGRGDRIAYAYLTYRAGKRMTEEGEKRLKAIQEFTDLGSGYKIAQRDLMIRGAGDILGAEQAGFIDAIGLDLYLSLLSEAVEERKTGKKAPPREPIQMVEVDAYIPDEYAVKADKLSMYREIEDVSSIDGLMSLMKRIRDVYGRFPTPLKNLFEKKRIDLLLKEEEFSSYESGKEYFDVYLSPKFSRIPGIGFDLFSLLQEDMGFIKVSFADKKLRVSVKVHEGWFSLLGKVVTGIHRLYLKKKDEARA